MKKLKKGLHFTDVHFGRKNNSDEHNQKCYDFIDYACDGSIKHKVDHIVILGDFFETRNAINISTINYACRAIKNLNNLNIPIYMLTGNHDMYRKSDRSIHSLVMFKEFSNVTVIDEITLSSDFIEDVLLTPYLMHDEYETILKYDAAYWYGHLEFNGFVVTGADSKFEGGPDHKKYAKFQRILSGHFHKRQRLGNVDYIGNIFSMDFSETDTNKGFAIHELDTDKLSFYDWDDSPRYMKVNLSDVLDKKVTIPENCNCKIISDIAMDYSELMEFKNRIQNDFGLITLAIEEPPINYVFDDIEQIDDTSIISINDAIIDMLKKIEGDKVNNKLLVKLYGEL
jgi:DNA repair exonuclease SbcCD nuclease subunit